MLKFARLTAPLLAVALLAGCGGSAPTQHAYHTRFGISAHSPTFGLPPKGSLPKAVAPSSVPTLLMLDSVDSSLSIFSGLNPTVVAGYTSGSWPTYFNYRGHFKYVVAVAVNAFHFGVRGAAITCLDVEPGDASPSEAGPWLRTEAQRGFRPCAYGSLSEWPAINQSIASAHVPGHVFRWDADWTYQTHLDAGFDATQWTDHYGNRNIDGSQVTRQFVNAILPKPPAPSVRCYHHGWAQPRTQANEALCNRVRKHDAYLGTIVTHENGYLAVSGRNRAKLLAELKTVNGRIGIESQHRSVTAGALAADLKKFHF